MTTARRARTIAGPALLLAMVSACTEPTPPSPNETSQPTPSPIAKSKSEIAAGDAITLLRSYYAVRDELRQKPTTSLSQLDDVAISTELAAQQKLFQTERKQGLRQTGATRIVDLTVQSVDLDNSDPDGGRVPTVEIDACFDVSTVDVIDRKGTSVVSDKRPDTGWIRYTVANYQWTEDPTDGWRVASSENLERTPCDGS